MFDIENWVENWLVDKYGTQALAEPEAPEPLAAVAEAPVVDLGEDSSYNEYFKKSEFACKDCGAIVAMSNDLIGVLTDIRVAVGKPVIIDSGYRCPEHNAAVGGQKNSQHLLAKAADFKIEGYSGRQLQALATTYSKNRIGGLGRSDHANYLHIDTREHLQHLATWCYNSLGAVIPYYD